VGADHHPARLARTEHFSTSQLVNRPDIMATTKAATVSIQKQAGYSALRLCAQTCVDRNNDNGDLEGHLECGDGLILNGCFCRADLRPKATAFLSSCIVTKCKYTNQDVTSALKLYDGYCSFKPTTSASTTKKSTTAKTTSTGKKFPGMRRKRFGLIRLADIL